MNKIKYLFFFLLLCALLSLTTGCRQRVIESEVHAQTAAPSDSPAEEPAQTEAAEQTVLRAHENKTAAETAPAPNEVESAVPSGASTAEKNIPDSAAGQEALSDAEGDSAVGVLLGQYGEILEEGLGSLYECQKGFLYLELTEDYRTVDNTAAEHALLLASGGYNVAEKRHDTLVDDGWIIRKNPTVIIKCVPSSVLGGGVGDTAAARTAYADLLSRPGWNGISAVIGGSVLLVSESLLDSEAGSFVLKLYIAREMYPELFGSMDADALSNALLGEGIYIYGG